MHVAATLIDQSWLQAPFNLKEAKLLQGRFQQKDRRTAL